MMRSPSRPRRRPARTRRLALLAGILMLAAGGATLLMRGPTTGVGASQESPRSTASPTSIDKPTEELVTQPLALPGQRQSTATESRASAEPPRADTPSALDSAKTEKTVAAASIAPDTTTPAATAEKVSAANPVKLSAAAEATAVALESSSAEDENALDALASAPPAPSALTLTVQRGDSLDRLFRRHGLSVADLHAMLRLEEAARALRVVRPGDEINIRREGASVLALSRRLDDFRVLEVDRSVEGFEAAVSVDAPERRVTHAYGRITSSLFNAGRAAGVSDNLVMELAGIFAWDIDFVLDIREGDEFLVLYEELWRDGKKLRDGAILAAEFVNTGDRYQALRYVDPEGDADYYTPEGRSLRKAFLRAPVDFSRISSNFNPNRRHPILNTIRAHRGVDYAAPAGTPIKAAGDGKVSFRGVKGGYGNTVILQHGDNITTLYAHLSRFASAKRGTRVHQGDVIGYVGKSGLASGNHLHYEYRVAGVHRDPRTVKLPQAAPVPKAFQADFSAHAEHVLAQLQLIRNVRLAAAASSEASGEQR